jgi:hypothetical protein
MIRAVVIALGLTLMAGAAPAEVVSRQVDGFSLHFAGEVEALPPYRMAAMGAVSHQNGAAPVEAMGQLEGHRKGAGPIK